MALGGVSFSPFLITHVLEIGSGLEVVILSLALGRKMKILTEENLAAHKRTAADLEEQVQLATAELRLQAVQLKELDQHKTAFFRNISHELRTPLTLILSPLESQSQLQPENDELQMAVKNSRRLLRLVNQLLDFQKLDSGKKVISTIALDLNRFVMACGDYFSAPAQAKGVRFSTTTHGIPTSSGAVPIWIRGEVDALEKVAFNYLSNALKYTPTGGSIELGLTCEDRHVRLFVRDTGPGIPEESLNKLFQVFS